MTDPGVVVLVESGPEERRRELVRDQINLVDL